MVYQRRRQAIGSLRTSDSFELTAHVETLWTQLLRGQLQQPQYNPPVVRPAVDVYQTSDAVVVLVEAPGMRDQEVRLEIGDGRLTISGEKRGRHCQDAHSYHQMEIAYGAFSRTVDLPSAVDAEGVSLRYEDGYIEIRLPRVQRRDERRVRITLRQP